MLSQGLCGPKGPSWATLGWNVTRAWLLQGAGAQSMEGAWDQSPDSAFPHLYVPWPTRTQWSQGSELIPESRREKFPKVQ